MDSAPSQPAPPEVKKGFAKVKGSSAIAQQSIQAVVSQGKVPTTTPSTQPSFLPTAASAPRLASPLQALEQEEYGTDASASSFSSPSKPEDPTEVGEQAAPLTSLSGNWSKRLGSSCPFLTQQDYKLGSALGRDPLLLQQEKLDRPPSIKLPMVADLSRLQTAQDDSVKPSTSNTLEIGKFPGIPPHKGSWYSVVDNKFAQTPQVVPQAFSNIAKPGYRSGPPASVQQKDLVKLEYMTRENISIANFLSTFGMASESCLNNLRLSRDQRESLFEQFHATTDGCTREQITLQLFSMTQQESAQMQFMLDISRSMSKTYADLVSNFLSTLANLVLLRRDAYLLHAHPNLDAFGVRNLRAAPVSGGDLFERSLVQEYEQHLIGLGVKPGSKKEQRFHPYKKSKRGRGGRQQAPQGVYYQPMPAPQYMVQQPFFQHPPQGGHRGGRGGRRGHGRGGSTGGNKQQQPLQ